ncbi:MAG: disulfide bond formation protein B [Sandarakinorhabdus sp.]|nr:disulfide bond formation protein B [Sandarakinorhabdus sp.]
MSPARAAPLLLFAVSGALLLGALAFEHVGGLPPCEMCYWQRYAHLAVLAAALPAFLSGNRLLTAVAILAMLVAAGLGLFHAGVELKWWPGVTACAAPPSADLSQGELLLNLMNAPLVRCDQIPWSLLGISMAGWNALISGLAALAAILLIAKKGRT